MRRTTRSRLRSTSGFALVVAGGFAALIITGSSVTWSALAALSRIRASHDRVVYAYGEDLDLIDEHRRLLNERADATRLFVVSGDMASLSRTSAVSTALSIHLDRMQSHPWTREDDALVARIARRAAELQRAFDEVVEQRVDDGRERGLEYWHRVVLPLSLQIDEDLTSLMHDKARRFTASVIEARDEVEEARRVVCWTSAASTLIALLLAFFVTRALARTHRARSFALDTLRETADRERALAEIARRDEGAQRLLADVSRYLASSLDESRTIQAVASIAVPDLADWCIVDLARADGTLERVAWVGARSDAGPPESLVRSLAAPGGRMTPTRAVAESGVPQRHQGSDVDRLIEDVPDEESRRFLRSLDLSATIHVPLMARGSVLGVLTLLACGDRRYEDADLALAEEIGRRAAVAIDHARLYAQAQAALERAESAVEARDDLLAIVSHDLKNPLSAIFMTSARLEEMARRKRDEPTRVQAERLKRSAERMSRLIFDLLDLASIDAGKLSVEKKPHRADALAWDAADMMRPLAAAKSIELQVEAPRQRTVVSCDRERIAQVFSNVVGNAIKFTPERGVVRISVDPGPDFVCFSVADTGPGVPPEQHAHIFNRFWRARPTERQGTGLGLSIAKGIVEAHGGRIWIDPDHSPGCLVRFTVATADSPEEEGRRPPDRSSRSAPTGAAAGPEPTSSIAP